MSGNGNTRKVRCQVCTREFAGRRRSRYCTLACNGKAQSAGQQRTATFSCRQCSKTFSGLTAAEAAARVYCSTRCRDAGNAIDGSAGGRPVGIESERADVRVMFYRCEGCQEPVRAGRAHTCGPALYDPPRTASALGW